MAEMIYSVSQLNQRAKNVLESQLGRVWLTGEISNFVQPISGHWYLTLKDEQAQVRCAMFRNTNARVTFRPENGMQVLVRAQVSMYAPRGDYQLIIDSMQPAGDGLLQQKFDKLKRTLAAEGLFDQQFKQSLPHFCNTVGVVTSKSGAALHDILNILARRSPMTRVIIYPTQVQGQSAASEIAEAIALANARDEVDVLIVGRGGGSLEDLWCFNEEVVARAIFASRLPIISAVGHETDVTIADFVADLRAPTPSAAAELVSQDKQALTQQLANQLQNLFIAFDRQSERLRGQLNTLLLRLNHQHPNRLLGEQHTALCHWMQRLQSAVKLTLNQSTQRMALANQRLGAQHPKRQLQAQADKLTQAHHQLKSAVLRQLQQATQRQRYLNQRLAATPLSLQLRQTQQRLAQSNAALQSAMQRQLNVRSQQFSDKVRMLDNLSPLKVLTRGYSITLDVKGNSVKSAVALRPGDVITTRLMAGQVTSQVVSVQKKSE
ncbi:exodeoxyribonuclease VII large subunit [Pasteurellaceae bacterium TAE3-ERU1]|nr:exodeoxyribonuclease VII large subunit [Pasteurellaceae bacterium TAE3-ERU1]